MPKSVYGEPTSGGSYDIPITTLTAPINNYNMRISSAISQLLNITKEEDKVMVIERLNLIQQEMALTVANSRAVGDAPPRKVSQVNRGSQNTGSRS